MLGALLEAEYAELQGEPAAPHEYGGPGKIGARRVIWAGADDAPDAWLAGASGTLGSGGRLDAA